MTDPQDPITQLQKEIDTTNAAITTASKLVQTSQGEMRTMNVKLSELTRAFNSLKASQDDVKQAQQDATTKRDAAQKSYDDNFPQIDSKTTAEQKAAVTQAIANFDAALKTLKDANDAAQTAVKAANEAVKQANDDYATSQKEYQIAQGDLEELIRQLQNRAPQLSLLQGALIAASAGQKWTNGYFLAGEVKQAITDLDPLPDLQTGVQLEQKVKEAWDVMYQKQVDAAQKNAAFQVAQQEADAAGNAYRQRLQNRVADILAALKPVASAVPAPAEVATPA